MTTAPPARGLAAPSHLARLTADLARLAEAIDLARSYGAHVQVPAELADACRALADRADPQADPQAGPRAVVAVPAAEVPLRRLVLTVVAPGDVVTVTDVLTRCTAAGAATTATVTDVLTRCTAAGAATTATAVSNALGAAVTAGALTRERRGLYRRPATDPTERTP